MSGTGSFIQAVLYVAAAFFPQFAPWLMAAAVAVGVVDAREDMRRAKHQARDAYNASLEDRLEMVDVTADQARTIVMGTTRCVEGVRRRWVSGANSQKLTMVVSFAGHEIDGFEQFYFDDVPLTLDGSGYVLTEPYNKIGVTTGSATGTLDGTGGASVTLPATYVTGTANAVWHTGQGDNYQSGGCSVSVAGSTATISGGSANSTYELAWSETTSVKTARIRSWVGTDAQNVGSAIAADYPDRKSVV